jgi:hypothetical protein
MELLAIQNMHPLKHTYIHTYMMHYISIAKGRGCSSSKTICIPQKYTIERRRKKGLYYSSKELQNCHKKGYLSYQRKIINHKQFAIILKKGKEN